MYLDGVFISMAVSQLVCYGLWMVSESKYSHLVLPLDRETYLTCGLIVSFLGFIGNLMTQFFKRCGNIDDSYFERQFAQEPRLFKNSTAMQIWKRVRILDYVSSLPFPMMFILWYVSSHCPETILNDPYEVSLLVIIKRGL